MGLTHTLLVNLILVYKVADSVIVKKIVIVWAEVSAVLRVPARV